MIQSVVVGNVGYVDPEAQADFANLSALTAGQTFTAADASEVPAALEQSIGATALAPPTESEEGTNWALVLLLVVALALLVGGAAIVVWRLVVLPAPDESSAAAPARASLVRRVALGSAAAVLGLAGVAGWMILDSSEDGPASTVTRAEEPDDRETPEDGPVIVTTPTSPPDDTAG